MRDLSEIEQLPTLTGDVRAAAPAAAATTPPASSPSATTRRAARWIPGMPRPYTLADGEEWVARLGAQVARGALGQLRRRGCRRRAPTSRRAACTSSRSTQAGRSATSSTASGAGRASATALRGVLTDWGFDDLGLERHRDQRRRAQRRLTAHGRRLRATVRGRPARRVTVQRRARRRRALRARCPATRGRGGTAEPPAGSRPRLAAADRRPAGRPPLRAGRRRRPSRRLRRPRRGALDPSRAGPVLARRRRGVHRRLPHRLLAGERARLADHRRRVRRTARERQPRPLRRPAGGGDRLLVKREARRRGVALAAVRLVVDWAFASWASSASRSSPTRATRRRRRWPAGSASRASACCAASSRRKRARAARGGSCRPRTAASRPATTRCSSCACAPTRRRRLSPAGSSPAVTAPRPPAAQKRAAGPCGTGGSFGPLTRTPLLRSGEPSR